MPSGDTLKASIIKALAVTEDGYFPRFSDETVRNAVQEMASEVQSQNRVEVESSIFEAADTIRKALPFALSIDNYLDAQRDDPMIVTLGKIGIASAILQAEKASVLSSHKSTARRLQDLKLSFPREMTETWHLRLVQLLTAGKPVGDVQTIFNDTAFIIFNYDRCVEYYLAGALKTYYNVDDDTIHGAMGNLKAVHPYGRVGALPWQGGSVKVPYGGSTSGRLLKIASNIRTFTESVESGVARDVKETMQEADTIVFLGFGFLPQNVELLTVESQSLAARVFFTTKGISDSDVEVVEEEISVMLRKREAGSVFPQVSYSRGVPRHEDEESWEKFVERETCLHLMNNNWLRMTHR